MRCRGERAAGGSGIVDGGGRMKLRAGWKLCISGLVLSGAVVLCLSKGSFAENNAKQEPPTTQDKSQEKTSTGDKGEGSKPARAKPGTKQAGGARLRGG